MKKYIVIISLIMIPIAAYAASGSSSYTSPLSIVGVGGGNSSSSNYVGTSGVGGVAVGKTTSTNYIGLSGGVAGISVYAAGGALPVISNIKVDGRTIVTGDLIKKTGTLTATVTDETGINTVLSSVEVDGAFTTFAALSGASTYDALTGALTFKLSIAADGDHTIRIHAVDISDNYLGISRTVKCDSGGLKATSVYMYPNPFNPNSGSQGVIAYQLNNDSDTSIYIFNAIGQLIYKKNIASGQEGAHIGYNEVAWDGKSDFGDVVANDVYFLRVVSGGKPIGRTKIAVIK